MDNIAQIYLIQFVKDWMSQNVFTSFDVLRVMDFAGGTSSYEEIEVLRNCERNGKIFYHGSVIPCSVDLRHVATLVER
jgi:hypothetical protein